MFKVLSMWIRHIAYIIVGACAWFPSVIFAWKPGEDIIPCGFVAADPCGFSDFILLIGNVIDVLLYVATFLAAFSFAYAGFLYVTSGGSPGKISQATGIFKNVAVGYLVALSAWLIVKTIESALLGQNAPSFLG